MIERSRNEDWRRSYYELKGLGLRRTESTSDFELTSHSSHLRRQHNFIRQL